MPQPYKLFTLYAREDAQYLTELLGQLRPLEIAGRIEVWSDREINPGVEWEKAIVQKLDTADIILILVSSAYYNSVYIHEVEIKYALSRHDKGEARVLPVIVRPCSFGDDPVIGRLQVLPTDGKPVTDRRYWHERDEAWLDVVAGVKRTLDTLREAENRREQAVQDAIEQKRLAALAAEQEAERTREAQARHERETEDTRRSQEQARHRQEEQDRGEQQQRDNATPLPISRYAAISGGALALLLAIWLLPKMFGGEKQINAQNKPLQTDTTRQKPTASDNFKPDTPSESTPVQVEKTEMPKAGDNKPQLLGGQKTEKPKPHIVNFNYSMKPVTGGAFTMGIPKSEGETGNGDKECEHTVTLGSFSMGQYEVTQSQWKTVMGNNPSNFKNCDDCPVENVSWNEVQSFIKKLNAATGKRYRLPTEAEWEYAARGGNRSKGYRNLDDKEMATAGWFYNNSGSKTHPVGGKLPNELGLYDMIGNVWEWCQDLYTSYPCDSKQVRGNGFFRVVRSGSWSNFSLNCRGVTREGHSPEGRRSNIGFRLASSSF